MSAFQQAENCLNIKLAWDIIQEKTAPVDRDFALHAVGKNLVERNADVYQEALANVEILCDMFVNVSNVSGSASALMQTKSLYLHFDEHEALSREVADLLKQSEPEKRNTLPRSKSQAQRFSGVVEACQKQEKFKSSKVVQRILSSKTATAMSSQTDNTKLTYVSNALFDRRSARTSAGTANTRVPSATAVMSSTSSTPISHRPSQKNEAPIVKSPSSLSARIILQEHSIAEDANEIQNTNSDDDWGADFYTIDSSPPKIQFKKVLEEQPEAKEQPVEPHVYDASTLNPLKLTVADYTDEFIAKIRDILEIEYNYLLKKVEKIQNTITNTAKISEIALTISQELLESTKSLTEADLTRLRGVISNQVYDQDASTKSAKPPLLQENKPKQLLASPIRNTTASLAGSMSTLKCLPKINK